jgi:hypothetical protein
MSFLDDTKLKNVASAVTKVINDAALVTEETINLINTKSGKKIRVNRQDADKYKPFGFVIEELDTDITENLADMVLSVAKSLPTKQNQHRNPKIVTLQDKEEARKRRDAELDKKHGDKPVVASVTSGSFGKNRGYGQGRYMGDSVEHSPFSDLIEAYTTNGMAGLIECINNNKQKIEDDVITEDKPVEQNTNINDSVEVPTTPQHKTFKQINEIRAGKKKVIPVDKFEKNPILSSEIVKDT